jgi:hypothetical protein
LNRRGPPAAEERRALVRCCCRSPLPGAAKAEDPQPKQEFEGSTHVIAPASSYFLELPETADAAETSPESADGQFSAGTKVKVIERGEAYIKVETYDGKQAYVPAGAVKENTPEG